MTNGICGISANHKQSTKFHIIIINNDVQQQQQQCQLHQPRCHQDMKPESTLKD